MSKKTIFSTFLIIIVVVLAFSIFSKYSKPAEAGISENVYGWAWSENIGWISFNCTNCEGNSNCDKQATCDGAHKDYGVNIESDGRLTGYAWSRGTTVDIGGIGWIQFNPSGPYPVVNPNYNYAACVDLPGITTELCNGIGDYNVAGWARAVVGGSSEAGGWDGWIRLRGIAAPGTMGQTSYGVWIDTSVSPSEFRGWAWAGDDTNDEAVIGWISFNRSNTGAAVDYKVMTSFNSNVPPTVTNPIIEYENYCTAGQGVGQIGFKWTYNDDNDPQSQYNLQISKISGGGGGPLLDPVVDAYGNQSILPGGTGTAMVLVKENPTLGEDITYGETYYWQVRARECTDYPTCDQGEWSEFVSGAPFSTPSHPYPWVDFTPLPPSPSANELVQFCSVEQVITPPEPEVPYTICSPSLTFCYGGSTCVTWLWAFPPGIPPDPDWEFAIKEEGDPYNEGDPNPLGNFTTSGDKDVSLTVTDSSDYPCTVSKRIKTQLPLPEWKEISPFEMIIE